MFDQMQNIMATPQAREMMFKMIAQQVAQAPKERREALARVKITLETTERGMRLDASPSDNPEVEATVRNAIETWTDMLARIFQSMGFQVEIVD
jgi:phenylalanyl-tRNA synthetase alpha subunit